jgi:hypothetical protein
LQKPQKLANQIAFSTIQAYHSPHGGPAMKQCRPLYQHLRNLTALAVLSVFACSQTPPKEAPLKYDPATEATLKGSVEEMKLVPRAVSPSLTWL